MQVILNIALPLILACGIIGCATRPVPPTVSTQPKRQMAGVTKSARYHQTGDTLFVQLKGRNGWVDLTAADFASIREIHVEGGGENGKLLCRVDGALPPNHWPTSNRPLYIFNKSGIVFGETKTLPVTAPSNDAFMDEFRKALLPQPIDNESFLNQAPQ